MVKLKNVRKSTSAPSTAQRKTTGQKRTAATRKKGPAKPASNAGVVIGSVGVVFAIGFAIAAGVVAKRCDTETRRLRATVPVEMAKLQESVNTRQAEVSRRRTELGKVINKNITDQSGLITGNQALELMVKELQPEADSLKRNRDKLQEGVDALKEDVGLMGEGVGDLRKKLEALTAKRATQIEEYRDRYRVMKAVYEEKLARPEPEMMRQFYSGHRHSPFAPAAGFFAAEKLYQKRRSQDALRYYTDILKRYPDSEYSPHVRTRLAEIEEGHRFEPFEPGIGFHPYRAPGFVKKN
ncbi:MAG: hypothetical protein HN742_29290 [Lentisphaerae bacterium]|jgi:TolA-binding protein|nr:hypothetical protein [Lentisphaerota bacterium]MBT4818058.1 hypothetical protein [Lentisphaerota bacterium]MBT5610238.1 hypothetical protein [Lentisphaerota bacterium]MBT7055707.1 hypothetical protein [Lentisphaerota bacterium]MBT7846002.1 hypothetical protein [Lentisphaerota bacterium]